MRVLFLLAAIFAAVPAFAALPPQYYEEARANAESVLVVRIERTAGLAFRRGYGDCHVFGVVEAVERGSRYSAGDAVRISVPCRRPNAQIPASGVQYEEVAELRRSRWGRAWLNVNGELALYQYDILASYP
jgi:hypothetical protein